MLHDLDVVFKQGAAFSPSSTGLVTRRCYDILKEMGVIRYFVGFGAHRRTVAASVPIPEQKLEDQAAPREMAMTIFNLFQAFFDANFPLFELTNSYACLDLESPISWGERETFLKSLALHESLQPDDCWSPCLVESTVISHLLFLLSFFKEFAVFCIVLLGNTCFAGESWLDRLTQSHLEVSMELRFGT